MGHKTGIEPRLVMGWYDLCLGEVETPYKRSQSRHLPLQGNWTGWLSQGLAANEDVASEVNQPKCGVELFL